MTISKIFDLMFTLYDIIWIKTCLSVQLHTKRSLCYLKFWPCFISLTFRVNRKNTIGPTFPSAFDTYEHIKHAIIKHRLLA